MGVALSLSFSPNRANIKEHPRTTRMEQLQTSFDLGSMTSSSHLVFFSDWGTFWIPMPSRKATAYKLMLVNKMFSTEEGTVLTTVLPVGCVCSLCLFSTEISGFWLASFWHNTPICWNWAAINKWILIIQGMASMDCLGLLFFWYLIIPLILFLLYIN